MYSGHDKKGDWYQLYQISFGGPAAIEARDPMWAHSVMHAHILAGRNTYMRGRKRE